VTGLHGLDIGMLAVLAASLMIGAWRGLVFELMSLAAWVVAYFVAMTYSAPVGPFLPIGEPGSALNHAAAVLATFVATLVVFSLLARLARLLIAATPLTLPDRLLGAAFGLSRGIVLLVAMATVVALTPAAQSHWWQQSRGAQWLGVAIEGVRPMLPADMARWLPRSSPIAN
jgi:membrane protein required for colicin V production